MTTQPTAGAMIVESPCSMNRAKTPMFQQFTAAIEAAPRGNLDNLSRTLWQAYGAGHLSDDEAQHLAEALQARQRIVRQQGAVAVNVAARPALRFAKAKPQQSPDRARSIARRRQLAASGPLPPALAANFTLSEQAVLRIVGDEYMARGTCGGSVAEIAARAGCGPSTARNAIRTAKFLGMLTVLERPRPGRKNLTNIIRIIRHEWIVWLRKGPRRPRPIPDAGIGFKKMKPTGTEIQKEGYRDRNGVWRPRGNRDRTGAGRAGHRF